jgi:hypothetical protein
MEESLIAAVTQRAAKTDALTAREDSANIGETCGDDTSLAWLRLSPRRQRTMSS